MLYALAELVTLRFFPTDIPLMWSVCLAVLLLVVAGAPLGEPGTDL